MFRVTNVSSRQKVKAEEDPPGPEEADGVGC